MSYTILEQAAKSAIAKATDKPDPAKVVSALVEAEKQAKRAKVRYSFEQLQGTWRLCFITGTKKTRARAGIVLGAGRYIPNSIKIKISYVGTAEQLEVPAGEVENCVQFGAIKLALSGVTKFLPQKNLLAFDFTRLKIQFLGKTLYTGFIRGGEKKEKEFYQESVGKQAFFSYFLVSDEIIAARGRGGGLALWRKQA